MEKRLFGIILLLCTLPGLAQAIYCDENVSCTPSTPRDECNNDDDVVTITDNAVCLNNVCAAAVVPKQDCTDSQLCQNGACVEDPDYCSSNNDCPGPTDYTYVCITGDVHKQRNDYVCSANHCVETPVSQLVDECKEYEDCIDGDETCADRDRECDFDKDCETEERYQCIGGDVYLTNIIYDCIEHKCKKKDALDKELIEECDPFTNNNICVEGNKRCQDVRATTTPLNTLPQTTTTTILYQTTSPPTTTPQDQKTTQKTTTTTQKEMTTTLKPTTTTLIDQAKKDIKPDESYSLTDRILYRRPAENIVDLIKKVFDLIIDWD